MLRAFALRTADCCTAGALCLRRSAVHCRVFLPSPLRLSALQCGPRLSSVVSMLVRPSLASSSFVVSSISASGLWSLVRLFVVSGPRGRSWLPPAAQSPMLRAFALRTADCCTAGALCLRRSAVHCRVFLPSSLRLSALQRGLRLSSVVSMLVRPSLASSSFVVSSVSASGLWSLVRFFAGMLTPANIAWGICQSS